MRLKGEIEALKASGVTLPAAEAEPVAETLETAREEATDASIEAYLFSALNGGILDEKTKKQFRARV